MNPNAHLLFIKIYPLGYIIKREANPLFEILMLSCFKWKGSNLTNCSQKLRSLDIVLRGVCQQIFFYFLSPLRNSGLDDDFDGWGIFVNLCANGRRAIGAKIFIFLSFR